MSRSIWRVWALSAAAALAACEEPAQNRSRLRGDPDTIVALPDGATMVAAPGTVARDLVEWLDSDEHERRFELGGQEFVGRSVEPTLESKLRLRRFVQMLKAHPDIDVRVVGHTDRTADPAADLALSEARASRVM